MIRSVRPAAASRPAVRPAAVALLAALASLGPLGCKADAAGPPPAPPPRAVEVLTIAPHEVRDTGEYLGSLLSRDSVTVLPQVTGYVRKIHVKPGQRVAAGAPLLEIDAREQAAAVAAAEAQQRSSGAALELARQNRERAEALYKEGLATAEEADRRRAEVATAEAAISSSRAQVSQQRVRLQFNVVRAAVPGVVGNVAVRVGEYVTATTPLTTIAASATLELTVAVPASRARHLQPGTTPIELVADDGSVMATTTPFYVAPESDPRTQLVELKAAVQNTLGLRPRELIRARVVFATREALEVPLLAVVRQSGQPFVFAIVEKGGGLAVERRQVKLGRLGEAGYAVEDGLVAGDRIAVSALQMLKDGAPVTLAEPAAAKEAAKPATPTGATAADGTDAAALATPPAAAPAATAPAPVRGAVGGR